MHTKRRDQTNVWTFRSFYCAQATVVRIVYVPHFKACSFTTQTAGTQRRDTAFVRDLRQRISLIKELRQLRCSKERIDHRRESSCIDEVHRSEDFIVTHIHSLAYRSCHTCKSYSELSVQLLTHSAHTTVTQVIDIIDLCFTVCQTNEVFDDLNNILFRQCFLLKRRIETKLSVNLVSAHFAEIITLITEK